MNNRALTLSVLMGVVAFFFIQSYVSSIEQEAEKKFGTKVLVVVAKKDIGEAQTLDETMLTLKAIPKKFLEPSAISFEANAEDPSVARDMTALSGTVALIPISSGEQITYNKITEAGLRTGLSPQVTPGKRAFSVPVSETTGVGKLVKPGDRVDVVAVLSTGSGSQNQTVRTILQDVPILAVGRSVTNNVPRILERRPGSKNTSVRNLNEFDGFASVTLEIDPSDTQMLSLILANRNNLITLSLRNSDDNERMALGGASMRDFVGVETLPNSAPTRTRSR